MAEGWIKLHRAIRKNWIWEDPQKLKWWLDILLQANHQDKKISLGNELFLVKRGCFHTSEIKLSNKWCVSKTTVRRFLKMLETDNMIETKKTKKGTTIKVSNYADYQGFSDDEKTIEEPYKNHSVYHEKTIEEPYKNHSVYTNNNDKELKNENNDKEGEEGKEIDHSLPPLSFPTPIHEKIFNRIGETGYRTWFMETSITNGNRIQIIAESKFIADVINSHYEPCLVRELGKNIEVKIKGE